MTSQGYGHQSTVVIEPVVSTGLVVVDNKPDLQVVEVITERTTQVIEREYMREVIEVVEPGPAGLPGKDGAPGTPGPAGPAADGSDLPDMTTIFENGLL